ncbi:MAG: non-hydrolyzing UDP-N-acetylglucosamine 2-epimerase [Planctomycetota bacterium]|jgi:UDP-N-acetylglucosamine 2-epimerase (non-hydrolysing)
MLKTLCVCGARPNFMKIAPLADAFAQSGRIENLIVHTGQHYDERMSRLFFDELGIPKPDINLEVGSASHAVQTAEIMKRLEPVLLERQPDWIIVVGDVNSTLAGALVATKIGVRVAHVEAGLRSFDRTMPEEVNRLLTDAISDLLFVTERSGLVNLANEGIAGAKVHFVGNVMIDSLLAHRAKADESLILSDLGLMPKRFVVVTLHRPSNVDDPDMLGVILDGFEQIGRDMPVVFPMHPRTRGNLASMGLQERAEAIPGLRITEPLGYLDFLKLMSESAVTMTDSGGIQEETTILGVPCLTLRENTERPVTVECGTNRLTRPGKDDIPAACRAAIAERSSQARVPELWDGLAAQRIADCLLRAG